MIDAARLFAAGSLVAMPPLWTSRWRHRCYRVLAVLVVSLLVWGLMALAVLGGLAMWFTPL